jgi:NAD(P)-dependent dehydrogenase (short-subunit alcohol dehydrogenase family)
MSFKVALVTGGASGLGEAIVRKLHQNGYSVAILDMNEERGKALSQELTNTLYIPVNVTDEKAVEAAIKQTVKAFGPLHVVVNSAGIVTAGVLVTKKGVLQNDVMNKVLQVNVVGTFTVCKYAAQQMISQEIVSKLFGRGVIINVASVAGIEGQVGQTIYSASKGAIIGMTLPMARDLGRAQIRVNTIAPGVIKTPMAQSLGEKVEKAIESQVAFGRLGFPEEFADCVFGIVNSSYVNGEVIRMDGGTRLGML